jgi:hypothetical protein
MFVLIVAVTTVMGTSLGSCIPPHYPWSLIGPPDVEVADMQAYQASALSPAAHVVLARTADGRVLSTGIQMGRATQWRWVDISGGHAWSDFPQIAARWPPQASPELLIRYEGNLYRIDASGQWQSVLMSDSPSPCRRADVADISTYDSVGALAGEVVKVQLIRFGVEAETVLFALVKGKGVYVCTVGFRPAEVMRTSLSGAIVGFFVGCLLAVAFARKS